MKIATCADINGIRQAFAIEQKKGKWILRDVVVWAGIMDEKVCFLYVPPNHRVEMNSVPWPFHKVIPVQESELFPYYVHSFLHKHRFLKVNGKDKQLSKKQVDLLLLHLMKQFGLSAWRRWMIYFGARLKSLQMWSRH